MSYIGMKGVGKLDPDQMFDLSQAKQMAKEGYDPTAIKIHTSWEKGIDAKWRYEIPDPFHPSEMIEDYVKPHFGESINISFLLQSPQLLEAYPELLTLQLYAMYSPATEWPGYYSPATNGLVVSMGTPADDFSFQIEGVLLHEVQHLIQHIEGFCVGGDPKTLGRKRYTRLAGEVEARNICLRHHLTEEQRRRTLRTATQDIPDPKQILIF